MAQQFPPPTDMSGLTEEDRISLGERMYQMIMDQGGPGQQQPMRQQPMRQQAMPSNQALGRSRQGRAAASLLSRPPSQGRGPGAMAQGRMGQRPMQPSRQRQMPQQQRMQRLPPPQAMQRFSPQGPGMRMPQGPMMSQRQPMMQQRQPMMQGLYNPLGFGFQPQQAPLMAFNPYQGMS